MKNNKNKTPSPVFYWDLRASNKAPYDARLRRLLKASKTAQHLHQGDLLAIKMHFGEKGNTAFISPLWITPIVSFFKKCGTKPFLTDTNTLYVGERGEAVSHHLLAAKHGFDPNVLGAPIIIADGLRSNNQVVVQHSIGNHFDHFYLAQDILDADYLVNLSHFKGHDLAGFGGSIKNLGMGCTSRQGKMQQHCSFGPLIHPERCIGCGNCIKKCKAGALSLNEQGIITLDSNSCVGCAACLLVCPTKALDANWEIEVKVFLERMVEYAFAVQESFTKPILHINFVLQVTPECDCTGFSDAPICPDLGVLCSYDPVALDQASLDLVNNAPFVHANRFAANIQKGEDKFTAIHSHINGTYALEYASKLQLGQREYNLFSI